MGNRAVSLDELIARRPVNEKRVQKLKNSIINESRALRLAELRSTQELTQIEVAEILGVDQSNISRIENGKFAKTELGTLQSYVEALGGALEITVRVGKVSHVLID
jgi:predicted XRE-type DNA-binding protein